VPITDPLFYADEVSCPDSLIQEVFKPADGCTESMPLIQERISIMRQIGSIFLEVSIMPSPCATPNDRSQKIPGQSYMGLLTSLKSQREIHDNTLHLLDSIIQYFPCFRDESIYEGQRVVFWKRAQILLAETWYGIAI
jgi:hypothetical protein